jgi:putative polymerase
MTLTHRRAWFACSLVVAAATFNMGLCYLNTHHLLATNKSTVITSEIIIISLALVLSYRFFLDRRILIVLLLFLAYFCAMWLITGTYIPKTIRDFLIPVAFFALGYTSAKPKDADKLLYFVIILVLAVGLFEDLFTDSFSKMFDILSYYVSKGAVDEAQAQYFGSNFYMSGERFDFEAGNTLQLFGTHRVSSIFLEPTGMGAFGTIAFMWLWLRLKAWPGNGLFIAICALLILASDNRFAMFSCAILLMADFVPIFRSRLIIFAIPFTGAAAVTFVALALGAEREGLDLIGRVVASGDGLLELDAADWFADFGKEPAFLSDAGYAYVVNHLGLVGCVALWTLFSASVPCTAEAARFKTLVAVYVFLAMIPGETFISIKTAALLWFLYGASQSRSSHGEQELACEQPGQLSPVGAM